MISTTHDNTWEPSKFATVLAMPTNYKTCIPLRQKQLEGYNPSLVTRIENDESTKMLGVYANFNGTFGVHAQVMKLKMDGMAARLEASKLSKLSSKRFYEFYYLPSTRYSLPVTSMTNTELRGIHTPNSTYSRH